MTEDKVDDAINCLHKNLIHFASYLEKEIGYDIETLSVDRVFKKEHFKEKPSRKYAPKPSSRPLSNFGKSPKTAIVCKELFFKKSLFKLQIRFRKIPLLVMYYLTKFDDVI